MNAYLKFSRYSIWLVFIVMLASCFKEKFPVVGPPDDITGDSLTTAPDVNTVKRKVLIIGISGCRGDVMPTANTPNINALLPHAIYSFDALTQAPTLGGPGWSSMLTGVWGDKHGVSDNTFSGNHFNQYPMVYKYIKQFNPQLKTVSICSWNAINDNLVSNADIKISTNENDIAAKDSAILHLNSDNPDVMFLNFDDVDLAGRTFGFDTTVSEYMQAISKVDGYVGEVLQALNKRADIAKEDWLVIISSDHGGNMDQYGGDSYEEKNIFTVFYNKNFNSKEVVPPASSLKVINFQDEGQYASVSNTSDDGFLDFNKYESFTVSIEVKSSHLTADDPFLTNKDWNSGRNRGWVMAVDGQKWKFNVGDGSHRVDVNSNGPELSDNQWHTIAITVDKVSNEVRLYQDGVLLNYSSIANITTWNSGSDVKLATGDDITGNYRYDWGNSVFNMANIRVWNTAISEDDMKQMGLSCDTLIASDNPYYKNLVGWWLSTEGSGSVLTDKGPMQRNMTVMGSPLWVKQQIDLCNHPLPPSVPTIVDIPPVVFSWLKITTDPGWWFDGVSWLSL